MSLLSKLLDDLEERQADLAGERDPVLDGLQRVADRDFHISRRNRFITIAALALMAALAIWALYRFVPLDPSAVHPVNAPSVTASARPHEQTGTRVPSNAPQPPSGTVGENSGSTLAKPDATGDNRSADSGAAIVAAQPLQTPAVPVKNMAAAPMPPALVDWSVRQDNRRGATITFRLTEKVNYRLYPAIKQDRITLEFAADLARARALSYASGEGLIRTISAEGNASGTTRIVMDFSQPVDIADAQGDWSGAAFDLNVSVAAASPVPAPADVASSDNTATIAAPAEAAAPAAEAPSSTADATDAGEEGASFSRIEVSADDVYKKGLALYQSGRIQEGMAQLRRALEKDPLHGDARTTLASCLVEQRQTGAAIGLLTEGLKLAPRQFKWAELKAHLLVDQNDIRGAIDTLQNETPAAAGNPDYLGFLAALLQLANRHEEAAKLYREIVAVKPGNGIWWMGLGISLERIDSPVEARNAYQQALADTTLTADLRGYINKRVMTLSKR